MRQNFDTSVEKVHSGKNDEHIRFELIKNIQSDLGID